MILRYYTFNCPHVAGSIEQVESCPAWHRKAAVQEVRDGVFRRLQRMARTHCLSKIPVFFPYSSSGFVAGAILMGAFAIVVLATSLGSPC